jgi:signal transduction histidine kinase
MPINDWSRLTALVESLHTAEHGLQYVCVQHDGVTVFQHHPAAMESDAQPLAWLDEAVGRQEIVMHRKLIHLGDHRIPVLSFTMRLPGPRESTNTLEIALRKTIVDREERNAVLAVRSMFRVSLVTVVVAFAVCVILFAWVMHREHRREQRRRAEEHLAFSGVMANGIVHDFRNPMSSLKLDIQMLNKEAGRGVDLRRERVQELSGRIQHTLNRMDKVFQEFLFLSRPSAEQMEPVNLSELMRECIQILQPRMEHKALEVSMDVKPSVVVRAYPESLRRGVINVIINAEQFSPEQGRIHISLQMNEGQAVLDVRDYGPGIPERDRKHIFDMFTSTRPGGTGLGLFLARAAVERSGGQIKWQPVDGPGTCIRITLPSADKS